MSTSSLSLINLIESRRIALTPEHGAGWCAEVYDDEAHPQYIGYGLTVDEAITAALSPESQAVERCHEMPGASGQRLSQLANQGE